MTEPKEIALPPRDRQPLKAELTEEMDMPGVGMEPLRRAFFTPVKVVEAPNE